MAETGRLPNPGELLGDLVARARRHETQCGGGTMVWRVWGEGPALVLLHGSHGSWAHWVHTIDELSRSHTLWIPDLPGMGDSHIPAGTDQASVVDPLASGIGQLVGGQGPVDLVGFSFGGIVATHLAAQSPALVKRLIVIGSGGCGTPLGDFSLLSLRGLDGAEWERAARHNMTEIMLRQGNAGDALAWHIYVEGMQKARFNVGPLVMPDHLVRALDHVKVPFGAIWGAYDRPHPVPEQQEAALRRYRSDLQFRVIADAGHWCMYEQPGAFNTALAGLLQTL